MEKSESGIRKFASFCGNWIELNWMEWKEGGKDLRRWELGNLRFGIFGEERNWNGEGNRNDFVAENHEEGADMPRQSLYVFVSN